MRTLWGRMTSINVQKVAWVLHETDLAYTRIDAGGAFGGLDTTEYRKMNPHGRIPTLQEPGLTLWESNAICRYLVNKNKGPLAQSSTREHAQADMWMEWFQNGPYTPFIQLFYQTVRLPPNQRQPSVLAQALSQLEGYFDIAEAALEGHAYLLGNRLTLADIPFGACLYRYFTVDIERRPLPSIERYYARLSQRAAYQNCVMIPYNDLLGRD